MNESRVKSSSHLFFKGAAETLTSHSVLKEVNGLEIREITKQ